MASKTELKKQRIKEWRMQVKQRKILIEISPETSLLFKHASGMIASNDDNDTTLLTYDNILRKALEHFLHCTEVPDIDYY